MNQERDIEFEKINKLNNPPEDPKKTEEPPKIADPPKETEKFEPVNQIVPIIIEPIPKV
jgi:hypothetical protein